jgi:hypothetical protein
MIVRMASVRVAPERIDEIVGRYRQIVRPYTSDRRGYATTTCSSTGRAAR